MIVPKMQVLLKLQQKPEMPCFQFVFKSVMHRSNPNVTFSMGKGAEAVSRSFPIPAGPSFLSNPIKRNPRCGMQRGSRRLWNGFFKAGNPKEALNKSPSAGQRILCPQPSV